MKVTCPFSLEQRYNLTKEQVEAIIALEGQVDISKPTYQNENITLSDEQWSALRALGRVAGASQDYALVQPSVPFCDMAQQIWAWNYYNTHPEDITEIGIDIETYSSVPIGDCGSYKYAESDDFEILLFCCSFNGGPVVAFDLASGDTLPRWLNEAIKCEGILKTAFNANFERVCLSRHYKMPKDTFLSPESWDCTMVRAARLALPMSLAQCGEVLGLEQQKMSEGKALIRLFSCPRKPTKNNPATRVYPQDAPEKWATFVRYCVRDVVVEQAIRRKVIRMGVTPTERKAWLLDQKINDRGVLLNMDMANNAVKFDALYTEELFDEAQRLTGLLNPNSPVQLKKWLKEKTGKEFVTLTKNDVSEALKDISDPDVKRVLQIRSELGKTSVAKFSKMQDCAGHDNRARGLFQFYGASRSGRFCLTGDHEVLTPDGWVRLDEWQGGSIACWNSFSEAISFQKAETNKWHYEGDMYHVKSVRCDMLCTPNHGVPYWTEDGWKRDEIQNLPARYEIPFYDSASQHYACTLKHTIYPKNTSIETFSGDVFCPTTTTGFFLVRRNGRCWITANCGKLLQLQNLSKNHMATLDDCRNLLIDGDYNEFRFEYGSVPNTLSELVRTALIAKPGCTFHVCDFSAIECRVLAWIADEQWVLDVFRNNGDIYCATASQMLGIPVEKHGVNGEYRQHGKVANLACGYGGGVGAFIAFGGDKLGMTEEKMKETVDKWRSANPRIVRFWKHAENAFRNAIAGGEPYPIEKGITFEKKWGGVRVKLPSGRYLFYVGAHINDEGRISYWGMNQTTHKWCELDTFAGKIVENCISGDTMVLTDKGLVRMADMTTDHKVWDGYEWVEHEGLIDKGVQEVNDVNGILMTPEHKILTTNGWKENREANGLSWANVRGKGKHNQLSNETRLARRVIVNKTGRKERVYDLRNCGKRHCFAVYSNGEYYLVHNCVQAIARDVLVETMLRLNSAGFDIVAHIHDECIIEAHEGQTLSQVEEIFGQPIPWAEGLPLKGAGYTTPYYLKD